LKLGTTDAFYFKYDSGDSALKLLDDADNKIFEVAHSDGELTMNKVFNMGTNNIKCGTSGSYPSPGIIFPTAASPTTQGANFFAHTVQDFKLYGMDEDWGCALQLETNNRGTFSGRPGAPYKATFIAFISYGTPSYGDYITGYDNTLASSVCITCTSDDRLKIDEELLPDNTTDILMRLRPQKYTKLKGSPHTGEIETDKQSQRVESGLIAQEVWYEAKELRHLINLPQDAKPIPDEEIKDVDFSDIKNDPDYSSWGKLFATFDYQGLIPYLIKGFQEQQTVIQQQKDVIDKLINANSFADFKSNV
jgi:hypothetical protein